jgi:kynurenine formamidase
MKTPVLVAAALVVAALRLCAQAPAIDTAKVIDLSYSFDESTIYWPTAKGFEWKKDSWGKSPGGYWYASATFTTSEHGGTHLDSPLHFGEGKTGTGEIPVSRLIGPANVIDVSKACAADRDYRAAAQDITRWEQTYGSLKAGDIVLFRTGWGHFWPDRQRYLGDATPGDASKLSFPGLGQDAARLLVERHVNGVGIDTASMDYGKSKDFIVHQILNGADIYGLENVANLEKLPARGATLIALPVKVKGGTGGPVRIIAILP